MASSPHVMFAMKKVEASSSGIIKNILSLNYDELDTIKEYLNNVLSKNNDPNYEVNINFRQMGPFKYFEFVEIGSGNPNGFNSLPSLKKAFRIADSERNGTNNMGFGIFSPITINPHYISINIFIQCTGIRGGDFYSISYYNGDVSDPNIDMYQGFLDELPFLKGIAEPNGTRSIWISSPQPPPGWTGSLKDIEGQIRRHCISLNSQRYQKIGEKCIITSIGNNYFDYLKPSESMVKINCNGKPVNGFDILAPLESSLKYNSVTYELRASNSGEYYIKSGEEWYKWLKKGSMGKKPVSSVNSSNTQEARLTIIDCPIPCSKKKIESGHRKIWVKIDKTFIFSEDFSSSCNQLTRAVLEFDTVIDNQFDSYIRADPNKSKSTLKEELKMRATSLINSTCILNRKVEDEKTKIDEEIWEPLMCGKCDKPVNGRVYKEKNSLEKI